MEFCDVYPIVDGDPLPTTELGSPGPDDLLRLVGGAFMGGLITFHTPASSQGAKQDIATAFPELRANVVPVAFDWFGRQFPVIHAENLPAHVLVFDVGGASS